MFLSGLQAIARLAARPAPHRPPPRPQHRRVRVAATRARRSGTFGEEVDRAVAHGRRPADRLPARRQRGAGGHRGDGQPAGEHLAGLHVRRRDRHVVRQGARARSGRATPSATPCSPARPSTAGSWRSSATTPAPSRRRCRRRATPRWSTSTCRSSSPATCRRRSTSAATRSPCRASCGLWAGIKLVSQVADGTGTVDIHPDRVVPQIPTMIFDGKPFVPHPERAADHALHARHGARVLRGAHRAGPRVRRAQPPQPGHGAQRRRLDRHRRLRHTYHEVREALAGARARRRRRDPRRRHPPVPAADAASRSSRRRCASSPTVSPRSSSSRRRTRRSSGSSAMRSTTGDERPRVVGRARRPGPAVDPRRRHARRRATDRAAAGSPRGPPRRPARAAARADRRTVARSPLSRRAGAVLLQRVPAQHQHPGRARHARRRRHRLPRDGRR